MPNGTSHINYHLFCVYTHYLTINHNKNKNVTNSATFFQQIYDTIYTEHNFKIFSNFYLPISLVKITNKKQIKENKNYS